MKTLLIINLCLQWFIIILIVYKTFRNPVRFQWTTTFFGKTRCGFVIWFWNTPYQAHAIFHFTWRNPETVHDEPYIKNAPKWAFPIFLKR